MTNDQFKKQLADFLAFLHSSDTAIESLNKRALSAKSVDEAFILYELIDSFISTKQEITNYIQLALQNKLSMDEVTPQFKNLDKLMKELPIKLKLLNELKKVDDPKIIYH